MEPRALHAHSRPPPYVPPVYGGVKQVPVSNDRRTVSTLCAPLGGLRPGASKLAPLLRRLWAPGAGVQACGPAPLTAHTPKCITIPGALVAASSISFASADGESSSTPLRLLSPQKPLRWVFAGAPFPPGQAARGGAIAEAYKCTSPEGVGGTGAAAGFARRKARLAPLLTPP